MKPAQGDALFAYRLGEDEPVLVPAGSPTHAGPAAAGRQGSRQPGPCQPGVRRAEGRGAPTCVTRLALEVALSRTVPASVSQDNKMSVLH